MPPHTRSRTTAAAPHEPPPPPPPRAWRFICEAGRRRLLCYKYSAVDRSLLSPYLQGYWNTVVTLLPPWLAPNCVTVGGLLLVAASTCLSAVYSPRLDALLPPWVLLAHASLLFAYQTLDAVDGKQARGREPPSAAPHARLTIPPPPGEADTQLRPAGCAPRAPR